MSGEFGKIFKKTVDEFKTHSHKFMKVGLLLYFIPVLLLGLMFLLNLTKSNKIILSGVLNAIIIITSVLFMIFIIKTLNKEKGNLLSKSWKELPSVLLFYIVYSILLMFLYLALIVPGIIFSIFWAFGMIIFVLSGKKGIMESLGVSKNLVKGRWWEVFGLLLLFGLTLIVFYLLIIIVFAFIGLIMGESTAFTIITTVVDTFFSLIFTIMSLIFGFNLYKYLQKAEKKQKTVKKKKVMKKK